MIHGTSPEADALLRRKADILQFPITPEDIDDIVRLENQFDLEQNCSGIAAPQIGISKQIIIFSTPKDLNLKKFRPDWTDSMPKTIWINPTYTGIEEWGFHEDYEACFAVNEIAGIVLRYKKIRYEAYDIQGNFHHGQVEGFLARIIQHEIDHLDGVLFIDRALPDSIMTLEDYREKRRQAMEVKEVD
jgi:peptide deformylase